MNNQSIHLTDYGRILYGRVPWTFAIECVLRVTVLYLVLIVAMRLMGKRMASQASRNELGALVSLAAATGPAIMAPDRGLLPPIVIASIIVGIQRAVAVGSYHSARFERAALGDVTILVEDGEIGLEALRSVALSPERLRSRLRMEGVQNLGSIERVYLEAGGAFTVVRAREPRPGLSLLPAWDEDFARPRRGDADTLACGRCGHVGHALDADRDPCERCGSCAWSIALRPTVV